MTRDIIRRGIINTLQATHKDLWYDATLGTWGLIADGTDTGGSITTGNAVSSLFEPFPTLTANPSLKIYYQASSAEALQVAIIDDGATAETIQARTRYRIRIMQERRRYENAYKEWTFAYTSPDVLSGTAATDRANVYSVLKSKINAAVNLDATAYTLIKFTYTLGGATGNETPAKGSVLTQQTSGATAKVARIGTLTGGSWAAGTAAGSIWAYVTSGTPTDGTLTWAYGTGSTMTQTNGTFDGGKGLAIVDNSGYFRSSVARGGKSEIILSGWTTMTNGTDTTGTPVLTPDISVAATYAFGIGTDMLAANKLAQFDLTNQDVFLGDPNNVNSSSPVAGTTYTMLVVTYETTTNTTSGEGERFRKYFYCWLGEDSGNTNRDALLTEIATRSGVTPASGLPLIP